MRALNCNGILLVMPVIGWACFCLTISSVSLVASAQDEALDSRVAQEFSISNAQVLDLNFIQTQRGVEADIMINGRQLTVEVRPHSIRSSKFVLLEQIGDGSLVERVTDAPRTVVGTLKGNKGSRVVGSMLNEGMSAKIVMGDGHVMFMEPIETKLKDAEFAGKHILYSSRDTLPHNGKCGTNGRPLHQFERVRIESEKANRRNASPPTSFGTAPGGIQIAELALDADFEYFSDYGSVQATLDRMELIVNIVNNQYEQDVQITHSISGAVVRSSSNDPYTSNNSSTLLNQFRAEWQANQTNIQRDVAHLFTGRELDGNIIGLAFVGVICGNSAFGLSQSDFNNQLGCATDLTAHELGHNWNVGHCSCANHTMNASITCANDFNPTFTIPGIIAYRDSLSCLDLATPIANDDFENAIAIGDGTVNFDTTSATTDGPVLPMACEQGFGLSLVNDIWYDYTATCTGEATFDFCSSSYDTRVAAYTGDGAGTGSLIACNDDFCGFQSQMTLDVVAGEDYLIRVGGFNSGGSGTMVVSCLPGGCQVNISVVNTELRINGTQGPDNIVVSLNGTMSEVNANQECFESFPMQNIQRVVINGFGGADTIRVNAPVATLINGGFGADEIFGSSLANEIFGGPGPDMIVGGPLADTINAGRGQDTVFGLAGDDEIIGGDAADSLNGGDGDDDLFGGLGGDTLIGGNGNDLLVGNVGADSLNGGDGNDELNGLGGPDNMVGGAGNDEFRGGEGFDTFNGGSGTDTALDDGEVEISIENT